MRALGMKVGDLAKQTGLTVRTLHHYDEIGLLKPSQHSEAGYRVYTARDVTRLQQIVSLRQFGFSLDEIRDCLDRPGFSPLELIRLHISRLRHQIELQRMLAEKLERIAQHFVAAEEVSVDEFLNIIQEMTMLENYYTQEQLDYLKKRREIVGEERIQQSHTDWADLIAEVRAEKAKGTDPADPKVQQLARRWFSLVEEFTGGNPGISQSVTRLWQEQGDNIATQYGSQYDPRDLFDYINQAKAALDSAS